MDIPDYFLAKTARQFGDLGRAWTHELPSIAERCQDIWRLTDCVPVDNLSVNFVCLCTSTLYGDVVLKIQGPHDERYTEIEALQLFSGRYCCPILALDLPTASFLLRRVRPGLPLRALKDRGKQLAVGAEMIAKLPIIVGNRHHLPTYADWLDNASSSLRRAGGPSALRTLLRIAYEHYKSLDPDSEPSAILHGDLHHDNILQAGPDEWVAIDPQGVVGPPFLEAGRFIQNHALPEYSSTDMEEVIRTMDHVSRFVGQPFARVAEALFILHTLSVCWDWEMREDLSKIEMGQDQCTKILQIIRGH